MLHRIVSAGLAASALGAVLMAPTPTLAGKADDTLNVALALEPEALDNYKIAGREGLLLARHLFVGLRPVEPPDLRRDAHTHARHDRTACQPVVHQPITRAARTESTGGK
jgi:hypothetical protein